MSHVIEGSSELCWGRLILGPSDLAVMAIVNATPDSFFDRGRTFGTAAALARIDEVVEQGAEIVDIGGIKAAPGGEVDAAEELDRVLPVVEGARARHPDLVLSVDTWRSEVADVLCRAGADVINDAWGGVDASLAAVAARHGAGLVCTHAGRQIRGPDRIGSGTTTSSPRPRRTSWTWPRRRSPPGCGRMGS